MLGVVIGYYSCCTELRFITTLCCLNIFESATSVCYVSVQLHNGQLRTNAENCNPSTRIISFQLCGDLYPSTYHAPLIRKKSHVTSPACKIRPYTSALFMGLPIEANMSAAERLKFSGPPPSGPGIFASLSKITDSSLTDETFNKWYNEVHVRDVLKTGCITKAYRFKHKNPNAERPYLAIYICPDMSVIGGERMKSIPMTSDVLGGRNCHDLANFDTRFYTTTQEILKENISQKGVHVPIDVIPVPY